MTTAMDNKSSRAKLVSAVNKITKTNPIKCRQDLLHVEKSIKEAVKDVLVNDSVDNLEVLVNLVPKEDSVHLWNSNWKLNEDDGAFTIQVDIYATCRLWKRCLTDEIPNFVRRFYKIKTRQVPDLVHLSAQKVNQLLIQSKFDDEVKDMTAMFDEIKVAHSLELPMDCIKHLKTARFPKSKKFGDSFKFW